ncbi:hypothetical protein HPB50_010103 [Hyalomma asiaticum]|uniref:Uncharacterized protein n=1 Tax=Hyalomma asiaticum TaxID=266040 RepID=A0ACB7RQ71_HYAAI|nr:hypothetical protein HPB50_010103 [Hyalomma asiaticum]
MASGSCPAAFDQRTDGRDSAVNVRGRAGSGLVSTPIRALNPAFRGTEREKHAKSESKALKRLPRQLRQTPEGPAGNATRRDAANRLPPPPHATHAREM